MTICILKFIKKQNKCKTKFTTNALEKQHNKKIIQPKKNENVVYNLQLQNEKLITILASKPDVRCHIDLKIIN